MVEFVHQAFHKFQAACLRVVCPRKQDLPGQDVIRLEAWRNGHHSLKTEAEQTRSGQQNKRQGNLRDYKTVTKDLSAVPARSATAFRLKRISEMPPKMEPGDGHREHDAHNDSRDQAGQCQSCVKSDATSQGQAISAQPAQQLDSAGADGESE